MSATGSVHVDGNGDVFDGTIDFTTCSPSSSFGVMNTGDMSTTVTSASAFGSS